MGTVATKPLESKGYLPALDGLRALSILLVLANHTANRVPGHYPHEVFERISFHGNLGVLVFFAISGILITGRLLDEQQLSGRISLRGFYVRRAFRILPPALFYLGCLALASPYLRTSAREIMAALFFYRNYVLHDAWLSHWFTEHFWSLSVEEHFYLLVPALLILAGRWRSGMLAGLLAVVWGWRMVLHTVGRTDAQMWPGTDTEIDGLFVAALLASLLREPRWGDWLRQLLSPWVTAAFGVASVWIRLQSPPRVHELLSVTIAFTVLGATLNGRRWGYRVLEWAPLRWIGRLSYSLYLWQQLFFGDRFLDTSHPLGVLAHWPWNCAAVLACASLSYYLLERPCIRLGHRFAAGPVAGRQEDRPTPQLAVEMRLS